MSASQRYAFCGNRFFVLEAMLAAKLEVASIAAVAGSYLERELTARKIAHTAVGDKDGFRRWLEAAAFDLFVGNGCPWRVPVETFDTAKRFVNVHPSFLPDLRGADPIPGALLFGRDSGATCHVMDRDFDSGDIIAQTRIAYHADLDAPLLYQLCFKVEAEVFRQALACGFAPVHPQKPTGAEVHYSFRPDDLMLDFSQDALSIRRRVQAFSNRSKLARIRHQGREIRILRADLLSCGIMESIFSAATENTVVMVCEQDMILKKSGAFLRLTCHPDDAPAVVGETL